MLPVIEGEWFDLGEIGADFNARSTGNPILASPFVNVVTVAQDTFLVAYPGVREGKISATTSRWMGGGINIYKDWDPGCNLDGAQLSVGWGPRFLRLQEDLSIGDSFTSVDPAGPVPAGELRFLELFTVPVLEGGRIFSPVQIVALMPPPSSAYQPARAALLESRDWAWLV